MRYPSTLLLVEQVTQAEIDAGAVHMVAVVNATDSQAKTIEGRDTHTVSLDSVSELSLGEIFN